MKKTNFKLIVLAVFFLSPIIYFGCKKEKSFVPDKPAITAEKTNVKTFEIVNLESNGQGQLSEKYVATFGVQTIELIKTSDSTLTFFVPEMDSGDYSLKFELAELLFTVTKTKPVDANQIVGKITNTFNTRLNALVANTPEKIAKIESMKKYRDDVMQLFGAMSQEQKMQTALFYEANKEVFESFSNNVYTNLDASTILKKQSDCPKTNFKEFYSCTALNLGDAANDFKDASMNFVVMAGLGSAMAGIGFKIAPPVPSVALGLIAGGIGITVLGCGYLLWLEVMPAWEILEESLLPYIAARWILSKAIYQTIEDEFSSLTKTDLSINAALSSLKENDYGVSAGTDRLNKAMGSLKPYWSKLKAFFIKEPIFPNTEEPITLSESNIKITEISNSNVQLVGQSGEQVIFKSTTQKEEKFSYHIKVEKEGFVEEKTVNAKILETVPYALVYISGNDQGGLPGQQLPNPLKVRVNDINGAPMENVKVDFELHNITGEGSSLSSSSELTNKNGEAQTNWTIGNKEMVGGDYVTANVRNSLGNHIIGSPFKFTNQACKDLSWIYDYYDILVGKEWAEVPHDPVRVWYRYWQHDGLVQDGNAPGAMKKYTLSCKDNVKYIGMTYYSASGNIIGGFYLEILQLNNQFFKVKDRANNIEYVWKPFK